MADSQKRWEFESVQKTLIHLAICLLTAAIVCCVFPYAMCSAKPAAWHDTDKVKIGMTVDKVRSAYRYALDAEPTLAFLPTLDEHLANRRMPLKAFDGSLISSIGSLYVVKGAIQFGNLPPDVREPRRWENVRSYTKETNLNWRVAIREPAADYFREFPEKRDRFTGVLSHYSFENSFLGFGYHMKFHFSDGIVVKVEREELD